MKKLKALFLVMAALAVTTMFTSCEEFAKALSDTMTGPMKVQVMNRCPTDKIGEPIALNVTIYEVDSNYRNPVARGNYDGVLGIYTAANGNTTKDVSITLEAGHIYKVVALDKTAMHTPNVFDCNFVAASSASKAYVSSEHPDCFIPTGYNTYNIKLYNTTGSSRNNDGVFEFVIEKTAIPR